MSLLSECRMEGSPVIHRDRGMDWVPSLCPSMLAVERILTNLGSAPLPILLLGEAGVGKDTVARRIHFQLSDAEDGFLKVVCAMQSGESFAAMLDGIQASNGKPAGPRTLFLDGIGDLNETCQAHLLHALPDHSSSNGNGNGYLAARLVCSSNRNLEEQLGVSQFHEELYFRICGLCLRIPPLRHRREDIPRLLEFFVNRSAAEFSCPSPKISEQTKARLLAYSWPGNVRELEQFARKLVLLGEDMQVAAELQGGAESVVEVAADEAPKSLKEVARAASRHAERELILKTLERTRWNRKRAAQELRISYKALLYKLKDIHVEESLR